MKLLGVKSVNKVNKDMDELLQLSQPLIELLRSSYNPHCKIVVEFDGVKLIEETCRVPHEENAHSEE